ncbi:non-hydrolyzing UDP-N-acetylglucosamine 2-epimerase [Chloroflexota bacterium]
MNIISIVGTRPNFVKIAPLLRAIDRHNQTTSQQSPTISNLLVHTGQHYDFGMSKVFFKDLDMPEPDMCLGVDSGTHAEQTGKMMIALEKVLVEHKPDVVVLVGDVNSTLAGALTAAKLHIPITHIEAGLRLFDKTVPEEVNRLLTDTVSDCLLTHSVDATENLVNEGISQEKIYFVGNIMIDSLLYKEKEARRRNVSSRMRLQNGTYGVLTLHRPENVDDEKKLTPIISALKEISRHTPIIFPCHPRTRKMIKQYGLTPYFKLQEEDHHEDNRDKNAIHLIAPLGYLDFLNLMINSKFIITDSGGIQEETTILNVPCLTLRNSTERPVTVREGTNILVGKDFDRMKIEVSDILNGKAKSGRFPELWDGRAAERIVAILARIFS